MKPDIIAKLTEELREPISSERQVVYFMVELRKLIELNGDGANYPALKFHCDWIAHPILQGQAAQEVVRLFDHYQRVMEESAQGEQQQAPDMSFMGKLGPTLTMTNFRNQLNTYLRSQGLDPSIPNNNENWANFLTYYAGVIEDCPLRCVSQGLKYTDEVVLKVVDIAGEHSDIGGAFRLTIEWRWVSKTTGLSNENQQAY
jgi:hypothetical protein